MSYSPTFSFSYTAIVVDLDTLYQDICLALSNDSITAKHIPTYG